MSSRDPLAFEGYRDVLDEARNSTGVDESVVAGAARIGEIDVEIAAFDFRFFGGSMGEVAGDRLVSAMQRAAEREVPFVLRTATGGARMQEGMRSLLQMPRLVAQRIELATARQPFIAVLGHPTTGGVLASIAALADVTIAEAGATIGFGGPRVAERFTGAPLPEGSHTATSAYRAGLVDELVPASDAHAFLASILKILAPADPRDITKSALDEDVPSDAWELVEAVRAAGHPKAPDLLRDACESFVELRGDRSGADDPAITALAGRIAGHRVLGLALDRDSHPGPAAYRKARRCVDIAGRLDIPIVTLVDTRGADPSAESEAGGIAWEIARLFEAILRTPTAVLSLVTGEGGSGGALAFATADRLVAFEKSIFSVIGPEGAAEILWRNDLRAPDAARALKLTAKDLLELGIADDVAPGVATVEAIRFYVADTFKDDAPPAQIRRKRWLGK